ncbi:MAG: GIY-YIG nuclease family protein, partial [Burkholderiaceae bacterium]
MTPQRWYLYLIECESGAYYAGITNDLERRYTTHCAGLGAKYTRANPPVRLVGFSAYPDRSAAAMAEWAIRQLPRQAKIDSLRYIVRPLPSRSQAACA